MLGRGADYQHRGALTRNPVLGIWFSLMSDNFKLVVALRQTQEDISLRKSNLAHLSLIWFWSALCYFDHLSMKHLAKRLLVL